MNWKPRPPIGPDALTWVIVAVATTVVGFVLDRVFNKNEEEKKDSNH